MCLQCIFVPKFGWESRIGLQLVTLVLIWLILPLCTCNQILSSWISFSQVHNIRQSTRMFVTCPVYIFEFKQTFVSSITNEHELSPQVVMKNCPRVWYDMIPAPWRLTHARNYFGPPDWVTHQITIGKTGARQVITTW